MAEPSRSSSNASTHRSGRPSPADAPHPLPRGSIVASGLLVGLATDVVVRGSDETGLVLSVWFLVLLLTVWWVARRASLTLSREARLTLTVAVLFAAGISLRSAPYLQFLCVVSAATAMALPALRAGAAWLRSGGVSDQLEAVLGALVHAVAGTIRILFPDSGGHSSGPVPARAWGIVRGVLLAVPFLLVFGVLLLSADPAFVRLAEDLVVVDLEVAFSHVLVVGLFAWFASGYLSGLVRGTRLRDRIPLTLPRPGLGLVEVATAMALVDLRFQAFVLVQFGYLFGGSAWVEATTGLTYADYARQGFAELVLATLLVLPSLLAADWILVRQATRDERIFRWLGGLQLVLLGIVVLSAAQRVRVYQEAYGLTESRFLAAVLLGWLVVVGVGFASTVLRGRRERFAFPALVSAFAVVAFLLVVSPDARIARVNLERAGEPDVEHLASLSSDAVPVLLDGIEELSEEPRCRLATRLLERWGDERTGDWRSWTLSTARARGAVRAAEPALEAHSRTGCARGGS